MEHPIVKGYIAANRFGALLGMEFDIVGPGEIIYSMPITKDHLATPYAAHGGSISALMDATMGVCALSQVLSENKVVSTVELKVSYISPALLGDTVHTTATIVKNGQRILFVKGEMRNQKGELVAIGSGTFNAYPMEKAGFKGPNI